MALPVADENDLPSGVDAFVVLGQTVARIDNVSGHAAGARERDPGGLELRVRAIGISRVGGLPQREPLGTWSDDIDTHPLRSRKVGLDLLDLDLRPASRSIDSR
jgi:hypothetical protein